MPVPLRSTNPKAEAKYNVSTEFPNFGLHAAAATGNVGLVEYALANGQPVNSVLDGVLPLHAACAGGNEQVVRVLLDHGADVNAPRLPRKYSNDKNRDGSAPIVGTSGSTPLHFAAANGNKSIVSLLLLKGAHADRADKHGVTPEMLAKQNGWLECAELLKKWVLNKDKDLRERQVSRRQDSTMGHSSEAGDTRKRVQVKRSIDNALNMLKPSGTNLSEAYQKGSPSLNNVPLSTSPPASPTTSATPQRSEQPKFGEYTFYPVSDDFDTPIDPNARRPSLPQIGPDGEALPVPGPSQASKQSRRKIYRRPRSAGNDADREPMSSIASRTNPGRKLGTKYSLMSLFNKRSTESVPGSGSQPQLPQGPASASTVSLAATTTNSAQKSKHRHRMGSDAARQGSQSILASSLSSPSQSPTRPPVPLAVDFHNVLAQSTRDKPPRDRSVSAGSGTRFEVSSQPVPIPVAPSQSAARSTFESGSAGSWGSASPGSHKSSSPIARLVAMRERDYRSRPNRDRSTSRASREEERRPGIRLNPGDSGYASSAMRALKLDSSSSSVGTGIIRRDSQNQGAGLRGSTSASSLSRAESPASRLARLPESAPPGVSDFEGRGDDLDEEDEDDEYAYGRPLDEPKMHGGRPSVRPIATVVNRTRGSSFASSDSLSPILSADLGVPKLIKSDFPFSLDEPPPNIINGEVYSSSSLLSANNLNRSRGDSLSSMGTTGTTTDDSQLLSGSTTTSSGGSATVTTPSLSGLPEHPPPPPTSPPTSDSLPLKEGEIGIVVRSESGEPSEVVVADTTSPKQAPRSLSGTFKERRPHTPKDLDLPNQSTQPDSEGKLQKAQQDILAMLSQGGDEVPLSARLAAYGEVLERQQQRSTGQGGGERKTGTKDEAPRLANGRTPRTIGSCSSLSSNKPLVPPRSPKRPEPVNRQYSLETPTLGRVRNKTKVRRRPHTSQGDDGTQPAQKTFGTLDREPTRRHHPRSASAVEVPVLTKTETPDIEADDPLSAVPSEAKTICPAPNTTPKLTPIQPKLTSATARRSPFVEDDGFISRVASLDLTDNDSDIDIGVPLTRVSTAPHTMASLSKKEQTARSIASAQKLTRMGFPSKQDLPGSYRGPSELSSTKRFGGLRSWFKGSKA